MEPCSKLTPLDGTDTPWLMVRFPNRSILILLVFVAFIHFGTPLIADLFFELYHLFKIDAVYSIYATLRYGTAQFMFWDSRWIVTSLFALAGLTLIWFRHKRKVVGGGIE